MFPLPGFESGVTDCSIQADNSALLEDSVVSVSPEFHRLVSAQSLLGRRRLLASGISVIASVCLASVIVISGGIAWILTQPGAISSTPGQGLLPLAAHLQHGFADRTISKAITALPLLHHSSSAVISMSVTCFVLLVLRSGLRTAANDLLEQDIAAEILRLRQHIHRKSLRLEPADLTGDQTRATDQLFQNATVTLENAATRCGAISLSVIPDLVAVSVAAWLTDWRVFLQTVIPVLLGRMALRAESQRSDNSLRLLSEQVSRGLARMAESLKKTRIVTSFGMEKTEQQQFENHLRDYQKRCRQFHRQQRFGTGIRKAIFLIVFMIPFAILSARILQGYHPAVSVLLASCLYVIFQRLGLLEEKTDLISVGSEKADEVSSYINRIPGVSQAPGAGFLEPMAKTLTFTQISFQTPQLPRLLNGLDLRIGFGETVALLSLQPGPAHALASMVPRFVDPDSGQVLIDGKDIRQGTLESLRAEAMLIGGQDPVFNATVLDNITCGQTDISRQQAMDAAKLVHADHFIRSLPRGYETPLGEHGAALDPGQIFRLSLARAAVRSPALLIIEEPQIMLDSETKAMLDDAYQRLSANRTVIFLPFRLSTVKKCQRIVLIHEGRVAVDGVHEQLVRTSELYRHWEYVRFNPFRDESE
jgi:ABC-type multidrug transport system fused ATPase/permease subunit